MLPPYHSMRSARMSSACSLPSSLALLCGNCPAAASPSEAEKGISFCSGAEARESLKVCDAEMPPLRCTARVWRASTEIEGSDASTKLIASLPCVSGTGVHLNNSGWLKTNFFKLPASSHSFFNLTAFFGYHVLIVRKTFEASSEPPSSHWINSTSMSQSSPLLPCTPAPAGSWCNSETWERSSDSCFSGFRSKGGSLVAATVCVMLGVASSMDPLGRPLNVHRNRSLCASANFFGPPAAFTMPLYALWRPYSFSNAVPGNKPSWEFTKFTKASNNPFKTSALSPSLLCDAAGIGANPGGSPPLLSSGPLMPPSACHPPPLCKRFSELGCSLEVDVIFHSFCFQLVLVSLPLLALSAPMGGSEAAAGADSVIGTEEVSCLVALSWHHPSQPSFCPFCQLLFCQVPASCCSHHQSLVADASPSSPPWSVCQCCSCHRSSPG
mmetsp:Transcript_66174/g.166889  ORF Transcript_66174/g.166889 Transcript_66174/m.166889 type:complete len:440 (+) Transcript_66174:23-1342(+)